LEDESLSIIDRSCKRMLYQIQDILDFSKFEKFDEIRINADFFRLKEILKDIRDVFQLQTKKKKLQFEISVENITENEFIFSDRTRLM
jgi:signal transduction histidine kinase